jgi:hypothetical protein
LKYTIRFGLFLWLAFLLAACSSQTAATNPAEIDLTTVPLGENEPLTSDQVEPGSFVVISTPAPIGADQALQVLAEVYGVAYDEIEVISVVRTTFSDSCLDIKVEGEICEQEETPGYIVILEVNGLSHIVHTTQNGNLVRIASIQAVNP